jgi:hypothetical protein
MDKREFWPQICTDETRMKNWDRKFGQDVQDLQDGDWGDGGCGGKRFELTEGMAQSGWRLWQKKWK